jgi:hypothetical protein
MRFSGVCARTLVLVCLFGCSDPLPGLDLTGFCQRHDCDAGISRNGDGAAEGGGGGGEGGSVRATCDDELKNNSETDVDCGGECATKCENDQACGLPIDCASNECVDNICVRSPQAAFTLSTMMVSLPRPTVSATSQATMGSSPIRDVSYDWDDGQGFEPSDRHTYNTGGSYLVRQRITDQRGAISIASRELEVVDRTGSFRQARFSLRDASKDDDGVDLVRLSPDRLSVEHHALNEGGVRSDVSIAPMSGVYYFEVERLIARIGTWGFGVATPAQVLEQGVGQSRESMGVLTYGHVANNTRDGQMLANCTRPSEFPLETRLFGFVVDYRAQNPRIHVVIDQAGTPTVINSCTMAVSERLHIFYSGSRYEIGYQARINTGADTTNHPFRFSQAQLAAALSAASQAIPAGNIVYGFGGTRAAPRSTAPVLANVPGPQSIALGRQVMLTATASDPEDGMLTDKIVWRDLASQHYTPVEAVGGTFAFTPSAIGRHPIRVTVRDSTGLSATQTVVLEVTGELPQAERVELTPDDYGGTGVELSDEGLSAHFRANGKFGIRANQGIFRGGFQYFEAHRGHDISNMGVGLIIGDGSLEPYSFEDVPWSCSLNTTGNTWRNLIDQTIWDGDAYDHYGLAVDYRGEHPIVHILIGSGTTARLESSLTLDDVWVPLYPMVYGNPLDDVPGPDLTVNFGEAPFQFEPRALVPGGAMLQLGWGVHRQ